MAIQYSPANSGGHVLFPFANPENPRIIDAALKRLCMIIYTLKYLPVILYHFSFLIFYFIFTDIDILKLFTS